MVDAMEIIISAVDSASEVFQSIIESATGMSDGIGGAVEEASANFDMITDNVAGFTDAVQSIDTSTLEELGEELGMSADEVQRLLEVGSDMGALSAGFNEASIAADELEKEIQDDVDAMDELGSAGDVMAAESLMNMASGLKDSMLGMADSAGTFNDSMMRASLEAEGAGLSVGEMKDVVSELSETTGRAGGQIRESFIKATARGVTDMDSFKQMMEGAGAQATLFGTDIQTMGDKFSSMAQKNTLMERSLAETGITMDELADAMGMSGATADEVKDKWKELDTNQRAAILGQAASMNEGKNANDEYKNSWAGLQEQMNIAKGRLERIVGSVILPVLIPAMKLAGTVLDGVGDAVNGIMSGPLGGLVSILGTLAGVFVIGVSGALALKNMMGFLKLETELAAVAQTAETFATIAQSEAGYAGAVANLFQTSSFGALATSAWTAATAIWAAVAPLLPFIAAAALVVVAVYEVGKAFGWWTNVNTMLEAIGAGLREMWEAFINHPDVQAVIGAISGALEWLGGVIPVVAKQVLEFFGISTGDKWNALKDIINGIGTAWAIISAPIRNAITVLQALYNFALPIGQGISEALKPIVCILLGCSPGIVPALQTVYEIFVTVWTAIMSIVGPIINVIVNTVNGLVNAFTRFANGQISLPTLVLTVLTLLWNAYFTILTKVANFVSQIALRLVDKARAMAMQFVSNIVNRISQLPGRVYSLLLTVVSRITSAGARWVSNAKQKASEVVQGAYNTLSSLPNKVTSALSGVVDAIVKPFRDAYTKAKEYWNQITSLGGVLDAGGDAAGGDLYAGGDISDIIPTNAAGWQHSNQKIEVETTNKLILDLVNVPAHIDTNTLIAMLGQPEVLKSIAGNKEFQVIDSKVKSQIQGRVNRARGA